MKTERKVSNCQHCGKPIVHYLDQLWHDDGKVFPQYCCQYGDTGTRSASKLHEPKIVADDWTTAEHADINMAMVIIHMRQARRLAKEGKPEEAGKLMEQTEALLKQAKEWLKPSDGK